MARDSDPGPCAQAAEGALFGTSAEGATPGPVTPVNTTPHAPPLAFDVLSAPPTQVGKYQVVRALGQGGQATALVAFDPDLRRQVVLKLYHAAQRPEQAEAVLAEGRALARVRSPFVAQVFAAERESGMPYLVVEYIPGRNLAEGSRAQPLALEDALQLVAQLAEGLAAVHACGLLHRDVKPANVILGDDGVPRLVDFGLAATLASEALGRVAGTFAYMSPEQARGDAERCDARTDLFGLGAVLYELLTGGPPYRGKDRAALLEAARTGQIVPVQQINPAVPEAVAQVCMRCLAKDPSQRFPTATDLASALRGCRAQRPTPHRVLLPAVVVLALVGIGSLGGAWWAGWFGGAEPASTNGAGQPVPLDVNVRIAGKLATKSVSLSEGEFIQLGIETTCDAYVGIWYEGENGEALMLFPNAHDRDHLIPGGRPVTLPRDQRYRIRVTPQKGREFLRILASTERWSPRVDGLRSAGPEDAYVLFDTDEAKEGLAALRREVLRGLEIVPSSGVPARPRRALEKVIELRISPEAAK